MLFVCCFFFGWQIGIRWRLSIYRSDFVRPAMLVFFSEERHVLKWPLKWVFACRLKTAAESIVRYYEKFWNTFIAIFLNLLFIYATRAVRARIKLNISTRHIGIQVEKGLFTCAHCCWCASLFIVGVPVFVLYSWGDGVFDFFLFFSLCQSNDVVYSGEVDGKSAGLRMDTGSSNLSALFGLVR